MLQMTMISHLALWIGVLASRAIAQPVVHDILRDVSYTGVLSESGTVEYFKGVHYAQDTSGEYRFAPPRPIPEPSPGTVIDASKRGAACPQLMVDVPLAFNKPDQISEDCLSLHIARPANVNITSDSKLPVLAWIHGGGVLYGSGSDPHTNPEKLLELSVELKSPVIFVGINYRLGFFGFATSDTLKEQKSMNVGMRDQRVAFEWIKSNIAAFGGDPDRVTSYGLSAGGTFTSLHPLSYAGEKGVPFDQAFMMSGPIGTAMNQTTDQVKVNTAMVADRLQCPTSGQEMLECLREASMEKLVNASYTYAMEFHPPMGLITFIPTLDDDTMPERASILLREGKFAKNIPTILAWTTDDAAAMLGPAPTIQVEEDIWKALNDWNGPLLDESQKRQLLEVYPESEFESYAEDYNARKGSESPSVAPHYYRVASFLRDLLFTCHSVQISYEIQKHSKQINTDFNNVWLYQLNQTVFSPLFNAMGMDYVGTPHGSDTNYIFNGVFPEGEMSKDDSNLARQFSASLISFANTGNPQAASGFSVWPSVFEGVTDIEHQTGLMPSDMNILVVGGPYGTTPVRLSSKEESRRDAGFEYGDKDSEVHYQAAEGLDAAKQAVMGDMSFGAMKSAKASQAQSAIEKQKLFRRCEFVASLAETMGQ